MNITVYGLPKKLGRLVSHTAVLATVLLIFVVLNSTLNSVSAVSTVPTTMNFQGRLTNSSGNIMADGLYNMKFRLYDASTGGTLKWNETRETTNRVQVTNGLFSVQLGQVTPMDPSVFASGSLYFEIELPTPGTATCSTASCGTFTEGPMTPRNKLSTSAYAYNSETLDGIDSAQFARNDQGNTFLGAQVIQADSATAFQVQNAAGTSTFLNVDTADSKLTLQNATSVIAGSELFTDISTCSGTGWTVDSTSATYSDLDWNVLTCSSPDPVVPNTYYRISFTVTGNTGPNTFDNTIEPAIGGNGYDDFFEADGSYSVIYQAEGSDSLEFWAGPDFNGTISNISVKPVTFVDRPVFEVKESDGSSIALQVRASQSNIAIGVDSGKSNKEGLYNVSLGNESLEENISGWNNVAVGTRSMQSNLNGSANTALGAYSLQSNINGSNNTALGFNALNKNISGSQNVAIGGYSMYENTDGANNIGLGYGSLQGNTVGNDNIALGISTLRFNTTGSSNIAIGPISLYENTTGSSNIALGTQSLKNNTTGSNNISLGSYSLQSNTTGYSNIAIGGYALQGNTTGYDNLGMGHNSLLSSTTGTRNISLGNDSLKTNTTGSQNIAIGVASLDANTTGIRNIAIGDSSLGGNVSGTDNVSIGDLSMLANITGYHNTALGSSSLKSSTTGALNTAIGSNSLTNNSSGTSNTAVGYSSLYTNQGGINNVAVGDGSLYTNSNGSNNTALGLNSLRSVGNSNNNTALGYYSGYQDAGGLFKTISTVQGSTAIGVYAQVQSANTIVLGSVDNATQVVVGSTVPVGVNRFGVSPLHYQTGLVTRTNSSTTLLGTGTSWTSDMVGDIIVFVDGTTGSVASVSDSTTILMSSQYSGVTDASPIAYRLHKPGFQVEQDGDTYVQVTSATAFQVQNAAATGALFTADTNSNRIKLGNDISSSGADVAVLVLDVATNSAHVPTGVAGAMYYDQGTQKFKCYTNAWVNCDTDTDTDTGVTSVGTFFGTSVPNGASISGTSLVLAVADGTNPGMVSTTTQTIAGNKTLTGNTTFSGTATVNANTLVKTTNASAFAVQNGGSINFFSVDTSGNKIQVGSATTDATAVLFSLDSYNSGTDPTGVAGAMYYNTNLSKYRCYEGGAWKNCITTDTDTDTGVTSVAAFSNTSIANGASIAGTAITFGAADGTNPGMVSTGTQTFAGAKTFSSATTVKTTSTSAFAVQNAGGTPLLNADTSGNILQVGSSTTDATASLFGFDSYNSGTDPTGFNGAVYYNTNLNKFRCYQNGAWANCISAGGNYVSLQGSTPGSADTGSFNITGTGIADILQGTTKVTTALVDRATAGTLNIGTTTATAISLDQNTSLASGKTFLTQGDTTVRTTSASAFAVQNASSVSFLAVNTSGNTLQVGSATTDATAISFILDSYNNGTDPTGTNGAMYYNSNTGKYRCYENGAWKNCITTDTDTDTDTGVTTVGTFAGASIANGASISGNTITFGAADGTNPGLVTTGTQTIAGDKTLTGNTSVKATNAGAFKVQNAGATETLFTADTSSNQVKIGNTTSSDGTEVSVLVLDGTITAHVPTGVAGAMYFDLGLSKFKCYTTAWVNCDTDTDTDTGVNAIGTFSGSGIANGASISGRTLTLAVADGTNPGMISTTTQTIAGDKTLTGNTLVKTTNANAFAVQNGSSANFLSVDTSGNKIQVGSATTDATAVLFSLDSYNSGTDPTGVAGAMYYNTNLSKYRCYEGGAWKNCITTDTDTDTDTGVNALGSFTGASIAGGASISGRTLTFGAADGTNPGFVTTGTQTIAGDKTLTGNTLVKATNAGAFQVQNAGATETLFTANTSSNQVQIGNSTSSAGSDVSVLVLDNAISTHTPTGVAGAMYYDSTNNKFKCYTTAWVNCDTDTDTDTDTGVNAIGTFSATSVANGASISGRTLTLAVADGTNPGMLSTTTQTIAGDKTLTGSTVFSGTATINANTLVKTTNASAFAIQNSNSDNFLSVDTSGNKIQVGSATTDATAVLFSLDSYNSGTDPTGVAGAMYYNTNLSKYRCYEGGAWKNCITTDTDTDTGVTSVGTFSGTSIANGASISGTTLTLGVADGTNPGMLSTTTQTIAGDKTFTGDTLVKTTSATAFRIQNATATVTPLVVDTSSGGVAMAGEIVVIGSSSNTFDVDTGTIILNSSSGSGTISLLNSGIQASMDPTSFVIQNPSTSKALMNVDASNSQVHIGSATTDATAITLVLDSYNNGTDPTGVAGATYYNSSTGKYRCYEGGAWKNCITTDTDTDTGVTAVGTFSGSSIANGASISGSTITFGPADETNPGMVTTGAQTIGGAKTFSGAMLLHPGTDVDNMLEVETNGSLDVLTVDTEATNDPIEVQIGSSSNVDAVQINLALDSSSALTESATCTTTVNQGSMYYNTATHAIRACVNATWEDVASTAGLGMILFGIVPDGAATTGTGDLAGANGYNSGPCKVYVTGSQNIVGWNSCVAYSNGRKNLVAAGTATVSSSTSVFQNLCLNTSGVPVLVGTANAQEHTAGLFPAFSINNPLLCLATIKTGTTANRVQAIYDTRVYTTSTKSPATISTAATTFGLGAMVKSNGTIGQYTQTAAVTDQISGVVVAYSGTTSTTTPNAIIVTAGPVAVKATAGTVGQIIRYGSAGGYGLTVAPATTAVNPYVNAGIALNAFSGVAAGCSASTVCNGSLFTNLNPN